MKPFYRNLLICFLLIVPMFMAATSLYHLIIEKVVRVQMAVHTIGGPGMAILSFALIAVLMPFATVLCWHFAPVVGKMKRVWTALIIVGCALLVLTLRIATVSNQLKMMKIPGMEGYTYYYSFENLKLESYFLGGLLAGVLIVYFGFRGKPVLKTA